MSQIIAGLYEIGQEIGAGGGGTVYLGTHLHLGKQIVLKADKRKLSAGRDVLRQEVDILKNLGHTYIPQVYDFVEEDGVVYTVMDYIKGESLDKPLKQGKRFPQAQIVEWAKELLEALCYLHSRPPYGILHGDIKPANIMVTPENDIRLIDFNIALALGEEGAVRVGFSRGYASPEHYGLDYSATEETQAVKEPALPEEKTEITGEASSTPRSTHERGSSRIPSSGEKKRVLLDVRSDIYSLGATLYHLLTGVRPAYDAKEVQPIPASAGVSPAVAAIIRKSMMPDPGQRYQTAADMLFDFEHLHENDPRTIRHKQRTRTAAVSLAALFLVGGLSTFIGLRQMQRAAEEAKILAEQAEEAERAAKEEERRTKEALAAVTSAEDALRSGDIPAALDSSKAALAYDNPYTAQAQRALTQALGVYNLSDGVQAHRTIPLSSAALKAVLSPNGTRVAVIISGTLVVYNTESGESLVSLDAEPSALSDVVFADENHLFFAGKEGLQAYDLAQQQVLWTGSLATGISLSADGTTIATVYKDDSQAVIYDAATGDVRQVVPFRNHTQAVVPNDVFTDPENDLFALNGDGTRLAVSFSDGALWLFDLQNSENILFVFNESDFIHFEGGFHGDYLAFTARNEEQSIFAVIDAVQNIQTGGFTSKEPYYVHANENGIYIGSENVLIQIDPVSGQQTNVAHTDADITKYALSDNYCLVATKDNMLYIFNNTAKEIDRYEVPTGLLSISGDYAVTANLFEPVLRIWKVERHPDVQLFRYDVEYRHDEARISSDGQTAMLFRYDQFRLYDKAGTVLADVEIPDAEDVYDQQFRRDGDECWLEVLYNSGLRRCYSATDGSFISEEMGDTPDGTAYDEYFTDNWRITSPLHGAPEVYDRASGKQLFTLESEDYLTYVTQVRNYVITEYITDRKNRYGLLLNEDGQTLAELPGLCDILPDGTLIFDDTLGNLRQSRIYSTQELMALG